MFLLLLSIACSQHYLSAVEGLGVTARRIAFHPSQPHQRKECVSFKPPFAVLRLKRFYDVPDLGLASLILKWHEHPRLSHVSVVFRDLVFQNQMVAKCI